MTLIARQCPKSRTQAMVAIDTDGAGRTVEVVRSSCRCERERVAANVPLALRDVLRRRAAPDHPVDTNDQPPQRRRRPRRTNSTTDAETTIVPTKKYTAAESLQAARKYIRAQLIANPLITGAQLRRQLADDEGLEITRSSVYTMLREIQAESVGSPTPPRVDAHSPAASNHSPDLREEDSGSPAPTAAPKRRAVRPRSHTRPRFEKQPTSPTSTHTSIEDGSADPHVDRVLAAALEDALGITLSTEVQAKPSRLRREFAGPFGTVAVEHLHEDEWVLSVDVTISRAGALALYEALWSHVADSGEG